MFVLNWSQYDHKCYNMNETQDTKKQTPILFLNNIILTKYILSPSSFLPSLRANVGFQSRLNLFVV